MSIEIEVDPETVKKAFDSAYKEAARHTEVPGFRKGKAPKDVAKKHIKTDSVYQELMRSLLPKIYEEIVKKESLRPIVSPKVELIKAKEGEDWELKMTLAEKPSIDLGDYRKLVKEAKEKTKKADIWVPGKGDDKENKEKKDQQNQQQVLNEIMTALLKGIKVDLSPLLIEEELNQRLTRTLDDIQKIGLTVEAYLKSKNITMEELRERTRREIEDTYKLEFILNEIADKEGVKVEKEDLDKVFSHIKDEKELQVAQQNAYFYASILRKQKTLDLLFGL